MYLTAQTHAANYLLDLGHKDCSRERGYNGIALLRVKRRLPGDWIAGVALDWVQVQFQALQSVVRECDLCIGRVEDDNYVLVDSIVAAVRVELHHNQSWNLALPRIQEGKVLLHLLEGGHLEEPRAVTNLQELLKCRCTVCDIFGKWRVGRIAEQWSHDRPLTLILAGDRQADTPICSLAAPVDLVEPVSGVIAILVHVLGAK